MALEFHFISNVTSESLHIDKHFPAFLSHISLGPRSRVLVRSRNLSVMLISMLGVWYKCLYTYRINGHCYLQTPALLPKLNSR